MTEILPLQLHGQCCSGFPPMLCISHSLASFYLSHLVLLFFITYCYLQSSVFLITFCSCFIETISFCRWFLFASYWCILLHHIEIPHDSPEYSLSFCKIFSEEFPLIHSQMRKTQSGLMQLTETVCVFLTTSFLGVRALTLWDLH